MSFTLTVKVDSCHMLNTDEKALNDIVKRYFLTINFQAYDKFWRKYLDLRVGLNEN